MFATAYVLKYYTYTIKKIDGLNLCCTLLNINNWDFGVIIFKIFGGEVGILSYKLRLLDNVK